MGNNKYYYDKNGRLVGYQTSTPQVSPAILGSMIVTFGLILMVSGPVLLGGFFLLLGYFLTQD